MANTSSLGLNNTSIGSNALLFNLSVNNNTSLSYSTKQLHLLVDKSAIPAEHLYC